MADVVVVARKFCRLASTAALWGRLFVAVRLGLVRVEEVRHGLSENVPFRDSHLPAPQIKALGNDCSGLTGPELSPFLRLLAEHEIRAGHLVKAGFADARARRLAGGQQIPTPADWARVHDFIASRSVRRAA